MPGERRNRASPADHGIAGESGRRDHTERRAVEEQLVDVSGGDRVTRRRCTRPAPRRSCHSRVGEVSLVVIDRQLVGNARQPGVDGRAAGPDRGGGRHRDIGAVAGDLE